MNNTRKILAILLAVVLVLALSVSVFADEPTKNDSITVNGTKVGETYKLYKMFDLIVNDEANPTAYSYTVNSAWADFFKSAQGETPAGEGAKYITVNSAGYVTEIKNNAGDVVTDDSADLAAAAAKYAKDHNLAALKTEQANSDMVVFSGLDDGYYLISSTLGTKAMIETTPSNSDVTVNEKNPEDTIGKEVKEDSTGEFGKRDDAQIGDTVEFKSVATLLPGTTNVKVHDKMDSGLTYNGDAAVTGLTAGTDYTVGQEGEDTFTITFSEDYLSGLRETTQVTITYTATLNENAVVQVENSVAVVDQTNRTSVSFGDGTSSTEDSTSTTTHSFRVFKHASGSPDNLADAEFELKKAGSVVALIKLDDNNYRVAKTGETGVETFTTVASGDIVIWGVDSDNDYSLRETKAPDGYNALTAEHPVTVNSDNSTRADVENKTGSELPSTGGIGTTIFYIVGGVLVVGAAVVLISKKRMNTEQ